MPLVLRYSTYSCKIDGSVSPNIAFGWVLDFGGSISRTLKGKPDEMFRMYTFSNNPNSWPVFDQLRSESDQRLLSGMYSESSSGSYDTEYDSFSFTHPSGGGSFYIKRDEPSLLTSPLRARFSPDFNYRLSSYRGGGGGNFLSQLELTGGDGVLYRYGGGLTVNDTTVEMAYSASLNYEFPSSWMLSSIKNDAGDSIIFHYKRLGYSSVPDNQFYELSDQVGLYNQYFNYAQDYLTSFTAWADNGSNVMNLFSYRSLMPYKIHFGDGVVEFYLDTSTQKISRISVKDNTGLLVRDILFSTVTNNINPSNNILSSVVIKDASSNTVQTYTLSYNNVSFSGSPGFDYWGYFNGPEALNSGLLPNRSFTLINGYPGSSQNVNLGNNSNRFPDSLYIRHNILKSITYPSGGSTEYLFESNRYSRERDVHLYTTSTGPGLRIKEVVNYDKDHTPLEKVRYVYGAGSIPLIPNNSDADITYTSYNVYAGSDGDALTPDIGFVCTNRSRLISPVSTAYMSLAGESVSYESVEEHNYEGSIFKGKSVFHYSLPVTTSFTPGFANQGEVPSTLFSNWHLKHLQSESLWEDSRLTSSEVYNNSGSKLQRTDYNYTLANKDTLVSLGFYKLFHYSYFDGQLYEPYKIADYLIIDRIKSAGLMDNNNVLPLPPLVYFFYSSYKGVSYPTGKSITYYYPGSLTFQQSSSVEYTPLTGDFHYPRTLSEQTSLGDIKRSDYTYPFDSLSVNKYRSMVNRHLLPSKVLSEKKYRIEGSITTEIEKYVTIYDSVLTSSGKYAFRPARVYYGVSGATPQKRLEFVSYNPKGYPTQIRQNGLRNISYIWSYSNNRPVAMVEGSTYSQIQSVVGSSTLLSLGTNVNPSESTLQSILSQLRGISGSVTQGASYRPLYGVSRQSGTTGNYTSYSYDNFQRLENISDRNLKIISQFAYSDFPGAGNSYVRSFSPDTAVGGLLTLAIERQRISTTYYDGIYRPVQVVRRSASVSGNDIVSMISYNGYGSPINKYLPYTVISDGGYRSNSLSEQQSFYNSLYSGEGSYAFTRREYEESPLQRVIRDFTQGASYSSASRALTYEYSVNAASDVIKWTAGTSGSTLANGGYYSQGMLQKVTTTDADGRVSVVYTDKQGKEVERRQGGSTQLITSFVYDNNERLVFVIPPKAQSDVITNPANTALCFKYVYDTRNRIIESHIPDKGAIYNVYDTEDRLVFTQDPNLRSSNRWQFIRYDKLGRELLTGIVSYAGSASTLRSSYEQVAYSETKSTSSGNLACYTNTSQPLNITANDLLTVKWYDEYSQTEKQAFTAMGNEVAQPSGFTPAQYPYGLQTGGKVKVLDGNEHTSGAIWLVSTIYYNNLDRIIQSVAQSYTGVDKGEERVSFAYRHQGEIYATKRTSTASGVTTTLLEQRKYDPQGRLSKVWNTLNGTTTVTEIAQTYDELERLTSTAMGNNIVSTAFTYDIQNRLRMINNPSSLGTKPFAMELQYNAPNVSGATAQYSGNISAVKWRHNGGSEQSYRYNYDSYSRLTDGVHSGSNNEQGITYDSNGNITALTRTGIQPAAMTYNYSGNMLSSIVKGGTTYTYAHDSNGNVTTDGIRGMTITYNYLNLPKSVAKGTDNLEFIYDATGVRLATKQNGTTQNYYTGAVVYKSDKTPDYILTSSGMIRKDGANYIRQYNITDHLGNVRSVVNQSGTVEQATDYYPYGLSFSNNNLTKNRYLYNGKEIQNQTLSSQFFGMYDYGARFYDPSLGRFHTIDNSSENYYSFTPYNYVGNNPIKRVDPDGNDWWDAVVGTAIGVVTNVVPGSTSLRESYTPTDARDYNNALRSTDAAAMAIGEGMVKGGAGAVATGGAVALAGGTVSLSGVGATVGVPATTVGGAVAGAGAATAAGGALLMTNGAANSSKGYNYGEKTGTKSDNKLKPSSEATGDHSSFKTDGSGKTTNTATYKQNPKNPSGFDEVKRVDVTGKAHNGVNTPHVHEPKQQVRPARHDELPRQK